MASNNTYPIQGLKPLTIFYIASQLADSQLWNSNFYPILIFGINEYLEGDTRNIIYLLYRIVVFIRQHKLEDRTFLKYQNLDT